MKLGAFSRNARKLVSTPKSGPSLTHAHRSPSHSLSLRFKSPSSIPCGNILNNPSRSNSSTTTPVRIPTAQSILEQDVLAVNVNQDNSQKLNKRKVRPSPEEQQRAQEIAVSAAAAAAAESQGAKSYADMTDEEILLRVESGEIKFFNIEQTLGDFERAVKIRRLVVENKVGRNVQKLPFEKMPYKEVHGQCCENVIGMVPIPVGVAGPILVDGKEFFVPMATTEGALVASTTRGCKAISMSGGTRTEITNDGMSRAPVLGAPNVRVAHEVKQFVEANMELLGASFNSTSRFARLKDVKTYIAGRHVYIRFKCTTGDAMGMNMVGKGVDHALKIITDQFPEVEILSLSGNVCTDKKPSAINWIDGRGKSVLCESIIKADIVKTVLKTTVDALVELNYSKNLIGSCIAGSIGGFNAHASNVVTALFLATGQDPAQNVESSTCMTLMEKNKDGDLYMSVTMPSLEVGTVGGGTSLPGQSSMLELLGVRGSDAEKPGRNAQQLARVIASTVMAGELSLMSALSSGHLIKSHMKLNRKPATNTPTPAPSS